MTTGKILGEKYIINGISANVSDYDPDMSADIYYEVVRMIDGKFLFLSDHLKRLKHSLSGSGLPFPHPEQIIDSLRLLQDANSYREGNIRICLQRTDVNTSILLCYFVPYFYPEVRMYNNGVQLVSFPHIRPNPGIKKWDDSFRVSVNKYIRESGVYEAILLNDQKEVTEGSRSNIFFIDKNDCLITAPEKAILPGITRKYIMKICRKKDIRLIQRPVQLQELNQMVSCFISGTSPKVLPVQQLDGYFFSVEHPLLHQFKDEFEVLIKENLESLSSSL